MGDQVAPVTLRSADGIIHGPECDKTMYGSLAAAGVLCTCDSPAERRATAQAVAAAEARRRSLGVEGLPIERCAVRWRDNAQALERGEALPWVLTDAQRIAGKAAWGASEVHARLLRAKVAASAAADKAREVSVLVDLEDW